MTREYRIIFTVEGIGSFPLDMLRYDGCFPYKQRDVIAISDSLGVRGYSEKSEPVTLCSIRIDKKWNPTDGRWKSFLWKVQSIEVR